MIKIVFYFSLLIVLLVTQLPIKFPKIEFSYIDKVEHFITFFYLSVIGILSYKNKQVLIFLFFYGLLIEILQEILPFKREFDLLDLLANTTGIFISLFFFNKLQSYKNLEKN